MTPPTIGRIVHYRLTEQDALAIEHRRAEQPLTVGQSNAAHAGDVYPAIVVRCWDDDVVNLQVFLDGPDSYWRTSAQHGDEQGRWFWPPRVDMTREGR